MNSKHYRPQSVVGPHPSGGTTGTTLQFFQATPSHCGIVARAELRAHARNANASANEIDFPVRVRSNDCLTPSTSDLQRLSWGCF